MSYKIFKVNDDGVQIYARIDDDGLIRLTCSADHPDFQEWVAEGNTPEPADSEE